MKKTTEKFTCQKSRKMIPGGPQKTPKILKKWLQNRQKSRKMPKKLIFWGVDFLMIFGWPKNQKRRHSHHRVISSPGPGLHWGTIGGTINQQPMNWLSKLPSARFRSGPRAMEKLKNWSQIEVRGYPKWSQNDVKIEKKATRHPKWLPDGSRMAPKTPWVNDTRTGRILGSLLGP